MQPFIGFFFVTLTGIFSSTLLKKLHLPWVAALIIGGIFIGPNVLDIVEFNETLSFIADMGLVFLMFMAGLDTKISSFKESSRDLFILAFINGFIPFLIGLLIAYYYGYPVTTMILLGTVFVSSSVAVVIPTLEANNLFELKIGKSVMITSIIQDVASLVMLSILLQDTNPVTELPLYIFYPLLLLSIVSLRLILPKIEKIFAELSTDQDFYQQELRMIFLILIGTIIVFHMLGLHSIIGGFFAGVVLSDTITDEVLKGKLRAISYGVFIPTFFIVIGATTDISILSHIGRSLPLVLAILFGSISSKFLSGTFGAKIVSFNWPHALFFGASSIPQLSTTLAVAYTAKEFGLISDELNTALVLLSIVSTLIGPILMVNFQKEKLTSKFSEKLKFR